MNIESAMTEIGMPVENRPVVRALASLVPIESVTAGRTIGVTRADTGRTITVAYGYIARGLTDAELEAIVARCPAARIEGVKNLAGALRGDMHIALPVNRLREGGERHRGPDRRGTPCPACGYELALTGVCGACD